MESRLSHFQIDILDDLQEIANTAYDRDADFQQDVSNIFLALKDPHTYATRLSFILDLKVVHQAT